MRKASEANGSGEQRRSGFGLRTLTFGLFAAASVLLVLCASAVALPQRGHVYSAQASFGSEGSGPGQMKEPSGVAVDEETGDVYVVDSGNNRIDRFNEKHEFIEAWGWGVRTGAKELQKCLANPAKPEEACKAGLSGHGKGQLHGARAIAIDNSKNKADASAGDIFVEAVTPYEEEVNGHEKEFEYGVFEEFSPSGELLNTINSFREEGFTEKFEEPGGIAVSPTGSVYVYNEEDVIVFSTELKNGKVKEKFVKKFESGAEPQNEFGLAVDSLGNVYVGHEGNGIGEVPTVVAKEAVVAESSGFYGEPLIEGLDGQNTTAVSVDEANNDPIIDNGESIGVFTPGGELVETLGAGVLSSGAGIAAPDDGQLLVADDSTDTIQAFVPEPAGAPIVDELAVEKVTEDSVLLGAEVDPHGASTTYAFRYSTGPVPAASEACTGSCVELPLGGEEIGESFGDVPTHQAVTGLSPSTTYHYLVVAHNAKGTITSDERHFKTESALLGTTLPDSRQWELVSPLQKNGAAIEAPTIEGGLIEAAEDGEAITYVSNGALPGAEGNRAPEVTQIVSRRGESGWSSTDIDTRNDGAEGLAPGSASEYRAFSGDIGQSVVAPYGNSPEEHPKLSQTATERTPFLRNDEGECLVSPAPESCFSPLVSPLDVASGVKFGGALQYVGSDSGLDSIVLRSTTPLTTEAAATGANLYEWSADELHLVNVLPEGTPAPRAELGIANRNVQRAISPNGSRLIWDTSLQGKAEVPEHLYMRDMARGETVQLDAVQEGAEGGAGTPTFVTASSDLSRIFFMDEARLTTNSTADPVHFKQDLYECQIVEEETTHKLGCKLTDLTVDANAGESATVQGVIPDVGTEGNDVYYVANGSLASGAPAGHCNRGEEVSNEGKLALIATCDLYVSHFNGSSWEAPKLIGVMSAEDEADWSEWGDRGYHGKETARVSPDGDLLVFMSDRSLTGYPNRDVTSDKPDEEVYLYDAAGEGNLTCVSCNPSGARPTGVYDNEFAGEGRGLLVDRPLTWKGRWISGSVPGWTKASVNEAPYESHYLFDDGRVFFTSAEALVPEDTNGKEDVYEYEPAGTGECTTASSTYSADSAGCVSLISLGQSTHESAFLDASATGNDVFLLTDSRLAPQDTDTSFDVYDASVCGVAGAHACLPPPAASPPLCVEEECRPDATSAPTFTTPASVASNGSANTGKHEVLAAHEEKAPAKAKPLTRAQKLAKALKACKKDKKKKKRQACERTARKKYAPAKKAAKKSAVNHGLRGR